MEDVKIIKNAHSAIAMAVGKRIPVLTPIHTYLDTRSLSFMNILSGDLPSRGQINYSKIFQGAVKAWHRHQKQIDFWICVDGDLMVGMSNDPKAAPPSDPHSLGNCPLCGTPRPQLDAEPQWALHIGEHSPQMLIIPPGIWHGCTPIGGKSAGLLYCVSEKYNPVIPDEERMDWDALWFDWGIEHK